MPIGNISNTPKGYVVDDFKPYREFLDHIFKIITKKRCDGKVLKWRRD